MTLYLLYYNKQCVLSLLTTTQTYNVFPVHWHVLTGICIPTTDKYCRLYTVYSSLVFILYVSLLVSSWSHVTSLDALCIDSVLAAYRIFLDSYMYIYILVLQAQVDVAGSGGMLPVHVAALNGWLDCCKKLISAMPQFDVNCADSNSRTLLHAAACCKWVDTVTWYRCFISNYISLYLTYISLYPNYI